MLPNDFAKVLNQVEGAGILSEDPEDLDRRLTLAIQTAALKTGQRDLGDLGIGNWILKSRNNLINGLHRELCDSTKGELKEDYADLLNLGMTPEGVTAVSAVVATVISTINPAFLVSNVIIFLAMWIMKRGLNNWCSLPA